MKNRCEGWHRTGGAFTLGPVTWHQCEKEGVVLLTVTQDGMKKVMPACQDCWQECLDSRIPILETKPIVKQ